mmetsp:Transcript_17805/g.23049  ORF Transcript_17805/g.23049 Transcript_17805/m.23049 type:complete len:83 (-) Transcript_17805:228-476(-)
MLSRACNNLVRRQALQRTTQTMMVRQTPPAVRNMGGGGKFMHVPKNDTIAAEVIGTGMWLWIIHRAWNDLGVIYGYRHAWDH